MPSPARLTSPDDLRSAVWPGAMTAVGAAVAGWLATAAVVLLSGLGGDLGFAVEVLPSEQACAGVRRDVGQ